MADNYNYFIEGRNIYLREVRVDDVNEDYYKWMNDPEVTQFLETRFVPQSMENIKKYVEDMTGKKDEIFLAICLKEDDKHIGNIKLGPINWIHRFAYISLVIGEKQSWGKGIASEAIKLLSDYAFEQLNLNKVIAGCYSSNVGSAKAFEKAGFKKEGIEQKKWFYKGEYVDSILMGMLRPRK